MSFIKMGGRLALACGFAMAVACGSGSSNPTDTADSGAPPPALDSGTPDTGPPLPDAGTPPIAKLSAAAIDFGMSDCGGASPADQSITLQNLGGSTMPWLAALDSSSNFKVVGATNGTINPGGSTTITLHANAFVASVAAGTVNSATLLVTTTDAKHSATFIPVTVTSQGATLALTPAVADFGQVPIGTQAPDVPVSLTNTGNKAATVAFSPPGDADFSFKYTGAPAAQLLAPNASLPGAVARFKPSSITLTNSTAAIQVTGAVCGASALGITMSGVGTSGVVGITPGAVDFGLVNCGGQAPVQVVIVTNTGNTAFTFTTALAKGGASPYALSPTTATVVANGQLQINVTPTAIPAVSAVTPNLYGDTLTITTNAANDQPHVIPLTQTARGAILGLSSSALAFGKQPLMTPSAPQSVTLMNTGNVQANVSLLTGNAAFVLSPSGTSTVAAGGSLPMSVTFSPAGFGGVSDAVSLTTTAGLCGPLPPAVALSGTGRGLATQLALGSSHTCALMQKGLVGCWGANYNGQLGNGTTSTTAQATPSIVSAIAGATAITAGSSHTCVITGAGGVMCWGYNFNGQLGNGTTTDSYNPVSVTGLSNVVAIGAGDNHTCAITSAGAARCWGQNSDYQLGDGTGVEAHTPVAVSGITSGAKAIVGGYAHTCALLTSGSIKCWGYNYDGEMGNGTTTTTFPNDVKLPVTVSNITTATAIAATTYSTCALLSGGSVHCWGYNFDGELGNNTTTSSALPVAVSGLANAAAIGARGGYHVCALRSTGALACWGSNSYGEIGNGNTTGPQLTPAAVVNVTNGTSVAADSYQSCAIVPGGSIFCWGYNFDGELGNGQTIGSSTPVAVVNF